MRLLPILVLVAMTTRAEAQNVALSGLAYLDYDYVLAGADGRAGDNGFGYRRIYLTADFEVATSFDGRFRLEAQSTATDGDARPVPFVKDAWFRWKDVLGDRHDVVLGVAPPPAMIDAEQFWGFRSISRTLLDKADVVDTRDLGLKLTGPIGQDNGLHYGVMLANDSFIGAETDRAKRVYGQVGLRRDRSVATVAANYAAASGTAAQAVTGSVFAGRRFGGSLAGVEAFLRSRAGTDTASDATDAGAAAFIRSRLNERLELVARYDLVSTGADEGSVVSGFATAAIAFEPEPGIRLLPTILVETERGTDATMVMARFTAEIHF